MVTLGSKVDRKVIDSIKGSFHMVFGENNIKTITVGDYVFEGNNEDGYLVIKTPDGELKKKEVKTEAAYIVKPMKDRSKKYYDGYNNRRYNNV